MRRKVLAALLLVAACKDKNEDPKPPRDVATNDAGAPVPQDRLPLTPYTFGNFNDPLGRFWLVAPLTFTKTETKTCNATECFAEIAFEGDGIAIRGYALPAAAERHSLADEKRAAAEAKQTLSRERQLGGKRGYDFWLTSADGQTLTWTEQLPTFVQPIRIELTGPATKRALLDDIAVRLATVYDVAGKRDDKYCKDLPWSPPESRKDHSQTWVGNLSKGTGFVLTLDQAVCDPLSRAVWEIEVTGGGLGPLVGKHVKAEGAFAPAGSSNVRPIVSALVSVAEAR